MALYLVRNNPTMRFAWFWIHLADVIRVNRGQGTPGDSPGTPRGTPRHLWNRFASAISEQNHSKRVSFHGTFFLKVGSLFSLVFLNGIFSTLELDIILYNASNGIFNCPVALSAR